MAAFLQLDVSPEHPAMRKFILAADLKNIGMVLCLRPQARGRKISVQLVPDPASVHINKRIVGIPVVSAIHTEATGSAKIMLMEKLFKFF